ncbi:pyridine nucleotide-disulfide oxidoreductase domain-containing protein [Cystoisospora suis]|uniref:Pyridine nucleotide-disulfide oxidoreductase domain-containing protein n=1 Tax=Cystoisospora suis TaxID=483139 RepID=A0A2C6LGB8_9APIC|nr:pyridine nucleotide-disulfide oxidoreductase domain-containing protein [Cystoisospora suis]
MLEVARNLLEGRAGRQKAVMLLPDDKEGEGEDKSLAQREKGMKYEQIPTSLLIWSIGLMSVHPDPDLSPFIKQGTGEFLNENGRIEPPRMISWNEDNSSSSSSPSSSSSLGRRLGGLYASGWVRRGAHGVIASNIMDARETVVQLLTDLDHFSHDLSSSSSSTLSPLGLDKDIAVGSGAVVGEGRERAPLFLRHSPVASPHSTPSMSRQSMGSSFSSSPPEKNPLSSSSSCNRGFDQPKDRSLDVLLESRGVRTVSFSDWRKIEKVEKERGEKEGKVAEKIDSVEEMLSIVERQS